MGVAEGQNPWRGQHHRVKLLGAGDTAILGVEGGIGAGCLSVCAWATPQDQTPRSEGHR